MTQIDKLTDKEYINELEEIIKNMNEAYGRRLQEIEALKLEISCLKELMK